MYPPSCFAEAVVLSTRPSGDEAVRTMARPCTLESLPRTEALLKEGLQMSRALGALTQTMNILRCIFGMRDIYIYIINNIICMIINVIIWLHICIIKCIYINVMVSIFVYTCITCIYIYMCLYVYMIYVYVYCILYIVYVYSWVYTLSIFAQMGMKLSWVSMGYINLYIYT